MGSIPAKGSMPSSKFIFPKNGGSVAANTSFTIQMGIKNLATGNFVNANENYFSAPQQLNAQGIIRGHSHVVIEAIDSLDSTTVLDPTVFAFFKGLNAAAENGVLTATVDNGLPAGFYKLSSINTAANHQPVLAPVAQHGSLDDVVYVSAFKIVREISPDLVRSLPSLNCLLFICIPVLTNRICTFRLFYFIVSCCNQKGFQTNSPVLCSIFWA